MALWGFSSQLPSLLQQFCPSPHDYSQCLHSCRSYPQFNHFFCAKQDRNFSLSLVKYSIPSLVIFYPAVISFHLIFHPVQVHTLFQTKFLQGFVQQHYRNMSWLPVSTKCLSRLEDFAVNMNLLSNSSGAQRGHDPILTQWTLTSRP